MTNVGQLPIKAGWRYAPLAIRDFSIFLVENKKSVQHHWILSRIIQGVKLFQIKLTVLIFWIKFTQKGYFWSKAKKMNSAIEFFIFELDSLTNFSLNWQFWFLVPNLTKRGISGLKQKKWTPPSNSVSPNYSG